jgi:putative phosphoesterase
MEDDMDIAVLSDIHSNHIALKRCVDFAVDKGVTNFLFLGDYVSDCPYPQRSMQILYEIDNQYNCWFVRGNREEYMMEYRAGGEKGWIFGSSSGCLLYTYQNLTQTDLSFFEQMPDNLTIRLPGLPAFCCCHGSMNSTREHLFADSEKTNKILSDIKADYLLCGHTHRQGTYEYLGKKLINPGSVGIPWYYEGKTQLAIIHGTEMGWSEEYFQLEYDREAVLEEYESSGFNSIAPMWAVLAKEAIKTGVDVTSKVLMRAMELCKEDAGKVEWPHIPEKYWEYAVREKGIDI